MTSTAIPVHVGGRANFVAFTPTFEDLSSNETVSRSYANQSQTVWLGEAGCTSDAPNMELGPKFLPILACTNEERLAYSLLNTR